MFAHDTNLFFEHKDISVPFWTVNRELQNINEWLISNKLSLNNKKDLPLVLPKVFINNQVLRDNHL